METREGGVCMLWHDPHTHAQEMYVGHNTYFVVETASYVSVLIHIKYNITMYNML